MTKTELINLVYGYFASERRTALTDGTIGIILTAAGVILWRSSGVASFQKGMAYPLIIVGIFLICACSAYALIIEQRTVSLVAEYDKKPFEESRALEEARISKVVNGGYKSAFRIFAVLIITGITMFVFYYGAPGKKGIACGLIIIGILGFAIEGYSKHKNRHYLSLLQSAAIDKNRTLAE